MTIIRAAIITDIHYGLRTGNKYGNKAPRLVEKFVEATNKWNPDFVLDMGDRISSRNEEEQDREFMTSLSKQFNKLANPLYTLTGNHDVKRLTRKENEELFGAPAESHSMDMNGFHFVFWNPNVDVENGSGLYVHKEDLEWLKKDLKNNSKPTILFSHVPLDNTPKDTKDDLKTNDIAHRFYYPEGPKIRKMIEKSGNVVLCMAGHRHSNSHKTINDIHYITLQSLVQAQGGQGKRSPYGTYAFLEANDNDKTIEINLKGKYRKTYNLSYGPDQTSPKPV